MNGEIAEGIERMDDVYTYRIPYVDQMDPFLMTIVSSSDLWMFVSSTGALTAGRVDRDNCVFPYETDDRLHVAAGRVGPVTVLRVQTDDGIVVWEPFTGDHHETRRSLLKSLLGDSIVFEEEHLRLGLVFRYRWAPSDRFGWVRSVSLRNRTDRAVTVEVVDGLLDVMPWGIGVPLQQQMSNLANAYRRSEIVEPRIGIFALESGIADRPEPAESMRATTVWSIGLDAVPTLGPKAVISARHGESIVPSSRRLGRPGAYLLSGPVLLEPGQDQPWHIVIDTAQSHADIAHLRALLRSGDDMSAHLDDDLRRTSSELWDILGTADAMQCTGSAVTDAHHLANTLFNVMRGGTFLHGQSIEAERFRTFVHDRNRPVAEWHAGWLASLPGSVDVGDLRRRAAVEGDPDLVRLAHEYLPVSFSRRHGDPSRPWNHFAIRVRDADGDPLLSYQGNWRDIFQNWEALSSSYPAFLPSIIAKFLSASTADGFNPYRVTSEGIDWEVPEPDNPWSGIGYWGDHQIVYLLRLLQAQEAHVPGWLASELGTRAYSFADVPYRIVPFERLLSDPKATVDYHPELEADIAERVAQLGADGKLLPAPSGGVHHASLLEKLLVPALAKISNLVPRGGIWMNTQRPEWNDANNALVGYGLSMVTLAHLRRYLQFIHQATADLTESHLVSADVIAWLQRVTEVLEGREPLLGSTEIDGHERARTVRDLGEAFGRYRNTLYERGPGVAEPLAPDALRRWIATTLRHLDDAVRSARRSDGLYESYNLLSLRDDGRSAEVGHLPLMLEGQVAAISSGLLDVDAVVALVHAMYDSDLYRSDVDSFVLYPPRERPPFLERNRVPAEAVESNPLLMTLIDAGCDDVVVLDVDGCYRFNADFRNVADLDACLERFAESQFEPLVAAHGDETRALYEQVFEHHAFTGRSSTMHAFEGIGSVYWHMVAKLLVAVQERILDAPEDTPSSELDELIRLYDRIRGGLGFNTTAVAYGAFPTDPYSHTPAHAGAQQPGMTGQVKEELLARWAELGLTVVDGSIHFTPVLVAAREFRTRPGELGYLDVADHHRQVEVEPGASGFTFCQVPIVVHASDGEASIVVTDSDGNRRELPGASLDRTTSRQIFDREGRIDRLDVLMPRTSFRSAG